MTLDQSPIPEEELPPGWGLAGHCDEPIAYRRTRPPIEVLAARTESGCLYPSLGLERCWELRYRYPIGELSVSDSIGCVSTRDAALEGLLECMHRIQGRLDEVGDPIEIQSLLEGISLDDLVPNGPSSERASQYW